MGKSAPDSPDPAALIKAQTDANRVNQYTPFGNLQYGTFDANGNFVPNTERESSVQTQRPQDQQFQNYSDAGRNALFQSIFGNYNAPAGGSVANAATGAPASDPVSGSNMSSLATTSTMSKPATNVEDKHFYSDGTPKKEWTYDQLYGPGGVPKVQGANQIWADQQARAASQPEATTTSAPPNPYGSNTPSSGIGSFGGFNLASAGDPNVTKNLSGWGNPNNLKTGLSNFYDLEGIKGALPSVSSDFSGDRQKAEDAAYARATGKFEPDFAERRKRLEQRLADTGNVMGSEGYNTEMDRLNRMENEAYTNAGYDAVNAGTNMYDTMQRLALGTRGQLFGEDTSLASLTAAQRGQEFGENQSVFDAQNRLRQMQLQEALSQFNTNNAARSQQWNEATGLLGIGSQQPNFVNAPQVDAAGIMQNDYQQRLNAYNNKMGGVGSVLGLGGQLLGAGLTGGASAAAGGIPWTSPFGGLFF